MATATKTISFELITPDDILINLEVDKIVAKSASGEIGILPNHADMIAQLDVAALRYWYRGQEEFAAVMGGVLEVKNNKVTIISDFAERGEDIDETVAHKEAEKAQLEYDMLKDKNKQDKDLIIAESKLKREMIRLKTSQLRRNK